MGKAIGFAENAAIYTMRSGEKNPPVKAAACTSMTHPNPPVMSRQLHLCQARLILPFPTLETAFLSTTLALLAYYSVSKHGETPLEM